ncbi:MAG: amidohydrolase family protein [Rubrivivax sp.]|nr:amidohydrolase family protein [Rubrivivax sp.]
MNLPAACNAHCHVFGPRLQFPYAADAPFVPAEDAPREALYALNDALGLQRCVVVQSTCHGFDNRVTEHAVAGRPRDYRGIALLRPDVPESELRRLDAAGFRGVRFNFMGHLGRAMPVADLQTLARRLAPLGWHLQLHGDPALVLGDVAQALRDAPVPVVIDHIGRIDAAEGPQGAHFQALRRLLDNPRFWVKVSGLDRISRAGPPYADAQPLARQLVAECGDRVLWGNDWPHPNHAGPLPDDAQLADLTRAIAPTAEALQRLLVHNPARLYRFGDLA